MIYLKINVGLQEVQTLGFLLLGSFSLTSLSVGCIVPCCPAHCSQLITSNLRQLCCHWPHPHSLFTATAILLPFSEILFTCETKYCEYIRFPVETISGRQEAVYLGEVHCNAQPVTKVCLQFFTHNFTENAASLLYTHPQKCSTSDFLSESTLLYDVILPSNFSIYLKLGLFLEGLSLNKVTFVTMRLATHFGKLQKFMKLN